MNANEMVHVTDTWPQGTYCICRLAPNKPRLRHFIADGEFAGWPMDPIPTRNALHNVFRLAIDGIDTPLILKVARGSTHRNRWRRLESLLSLWTSDRAGRALSHAAAVRDRAAIVPLPLAAWSCRTGLSLQRYHLSECIEYTATLRSLLDDPKARDAHNLTEETLARRLADLIRALHGTGYWHRDPAPLNILVRVGAEPGAAPQFFLIDTDALFPVPMAVRCGLLPGDLWPFWSCKRLLRHLPEPLCRTFAEAYLEKPCPDALLEHILFIRNHGHENLAGRGRLAARSFLYHWIQKPLSQTPPP